MQAGHRLITVSRARHPVQMLSSGRLLLGSLGAASLGIAASTGRLGVILADRNDDKEPYQTSSVPSRAQQLSRAKDSSKERPFDLLIIGGGATGAGCAVDATTR